MSLSPFRQKSFVVKLVSVAFFVLLLQFTAKSDQSLTLAWDPASDPSVVGFELSYGTESGTYTESTNVGNLTRATVANLKEGEIYYFAIRSYDERGVESDYSGEIAYLVPGILIMTRGAELNDPPRIVFPVAPGHTYEVQSSDDLQNWSTVWVTTAFGNYWAEFIDQDSPSSPLKFYRLVMR